MAGMARDRRGDPPHAMRDGLRCGRFAVILPWRIMAHLEVITGPEPGRCYALRDPVSRLGRSRECAVPVRDARVSRQHAEIHRDGPLLTLVDLGSSNGVRVNGRKVRERLLDFGDRLMVGGVEFMLRPDAGDQPLSELIPGYVLKERIGEGGMGIVFRAEQRSLSRSVAVKLLPPRRQHDPAAVAQFVDEARIAGRLSHPNLIHVHDVVSGGALHYFSMELIEGPTAAQVLRDLGPLLPAEALAIASQTARALSCIHGGGLIHRDVKPDNLIIASGNAVKLADLGIASAIEPDEATANSTTDLNAPVVGTPQYLAPEIALGLRLDHRADLYALGATLYHLLAGKLPHPGTDYPEMIRGHCYEPVVDVRRHNAEVDSPTAKLVADLLAKRPGDRPADAAEVELRIGACLDRCSPGTSILGRWTLRGQRRITPGEHPTAGTIAMPEKRWWWPFESG
jgi:serine/threonine protein kinase